MDISALMKTKKILFVSIAALLAVACDKSVESQSDTSSQKSIVENALDTAASTKDAAANLITTSKEAIVEKSQSAAEITSTFIKEKSSQVVNIGEQANEKITEVGDAVKGKAEDIMSNIPSEDVGNNDALNHINDNN